MPSSPRRRIRLASVAGGLKDCSDPVGSTHLRRLDTSNGCQDHTVSPYASAPVVCALCPLTDDRPALRTPHAPDAAASTATRPSFVTMANAPLGGTGWGRDVKVIWGWRQGKFLQIRNEVNREALSRRRFLVPSTVMGLVVLNPSPSSDKGLCLWKRRLVVRAHPTVPQYQQLSSHRQILQIA